MLRRRAVSIERVTRAVDPERRESECLGADRVPRIRRHETDADGGAIECIDGKLIDTRTRLVDAGIVDGQNDVEVAASPVAAASGSSIACVPLDRISRGRGASAASVGTASAKRRQIEIGVEQAVPRRGLATSASASAA